MITEVFEVSVRLKTRIQVRRINDLVAAKVLELRQEHGGMDDVSVHLLSMWLKGNTRCCEYGFMVERLHSHEV